MKNLTDHYPRALVISHNCFSRQGSNGRTLAALFAGWPKDRLAQFFVIREAPDTSVCDNYFNVTDGQAARALFRGRQAPGVGLDNFGAVKSAKRKAPSRFFRKMRRTPVFYLARNFAWNIGRWRGENFSAWLDDFSPEIILLQVGCYTFTPKLALDVADKFGIPIVLYNCEDYYFKDRKSISPLYHISRFQLKRNFEKLLSRARHTVYICEALQETYNKKFRHESTVIMTSTDIRPAREAISGGRFTVSYLGNLSLGRHLMLCEIATVLRRINPELSLDVYGRIPNEKVTRDFAASPGINHRGYVDYDTVVDVLRGSDLLVHAENFAPFYRWDLRHAFSTKIAESLASGACFFVYAPENLAFVQYLENHGAACVVTDPARLRPALEKLIADADLRRQITGRALTLAAANHDRAKNSRRFRDIMARCATAGRAGAP